MARSNETPGDRLKDLWSTLSSLPGGRWVFSRLLGLMVPYTNSIRSTVLDFEPGHARVLLKDRRRVRNHLRSVHAIALANVGELVTGLSLISGLGSDLRAILTGLDVRYTKKARGPLVAEATCTIPDVTEPMDHPVEATIRDGDGDVVATVTAHWRLGRAGVR
jgi:acyl-coenzyme A thioesterase PaaI-like protein